MNRAAQPASPVFRSLPPSGGAARGHVLAVGAATDRGRIRSTNQDAFGHSVAGQYFALCDGMGGAAGGEIASRVTIETLLEQMGGADPLAAASSRAIVRALESAVGTANRILYARAEREPALSGMGTTLVSLLVRGSRAWVMHVGDSRCYLLRAGELTRCTEDHSLVGEQVRLGILSEQDAEESPLRNVITRAVGVREDLQPEVRELEILPADVFLLCSDGLTREVGEEQIRALLSATTTPDEACQVLINEANRNGGRDNITCMVVRVS